MASRNASRLSAAAALGAATCWWACADAGSPNAATDGEPPADASAAVVDAPAADVTDAGSSVDAEPDALGLPDASWCDSLSADAGVKQLLFCADFDDGSFSRVGEAFLQWSTNASLQIANAAFLSPSSSMTAKTAPVVPNHATTPGVDVDQSFARIAGHAEPVFRDAEVDLSFRMSSPFNAEAGAAPTELYSSDFGWFTTWLRLRPTNSGQARLSMRVLSTWTGPVPDAAAAGSNDEFVDDIDVATAPIGVGEWIDCRLRVSFTTQPAGDASAHVELDVKRNAVWNTVLNYDRASTRYRSFIFYIFGVTSFFGTDATSFDYDNLAVFLR